MRRLPRSVAVVALAVCGVVSAAVVVGAATLPHVHSPASSGQRAHRVKAPDYTLVIGDSAIAYVRWVPGASSAVIGFDRYLDLESCRRLVEESCTGRERRKPPTVLEALRAAGTRARTLVVSTGYNDGSVGFESQPAASAARMQAGRTRVRRMSAPGGGVNEQRPVLYISRRIEVPMPESSHNDIPGTVTRRTRA